MKMKELAINQMNEQKTNYDINYVTDSVNGLVSIDSASFNILRSLMYGQEDFESAFDDVQECVYQTAVLKGQWKDKTYSEVMLHVYSEVAELWAEIDACNGDSETIPGYSKREEEAADVVLMIMSLAKRVDWRLGEAIVAKAKYNLTRERNK